MSSSQEPWRMIAQRKQSQRAALIPKAWTIPPQALPSTSVLDVTDVPRTCGILSAKELEITEKNDATELAAAIRQKKYTSVEVATAFCKRAAIAQQLTNCLTEILFEKALAQAAFLDNYLEKYGKTMGPLHGVPISVKDTFRITGVDSSIGFASLCFKPSTYTAPLVSLLTEAGAVIHCKTNIPQTMMALDSINNVFGRTLNPLNRKVTAGGSSGGAGVMAGMKASPIAVGTDIGGSIRIPAMCNGVFGLKPSANRVPYAGQEGGGVDGVDLLAVEASAGPITASLRDCELFMKAVADAQPWTTLPRIIPGAWDAMDTGSSKGTENLTIGILSYDNVMRPLPPISKLLNETATALEKAGHKVVHITPPTALGQAQSLANKLFGIEGGNAMFAHMTATKEPLIPWLAGRLRPKKPLTISETAALRSAQRDMQKELLSMWKTADGKDIDVIVCPVAPHPVPPIDRWNGVSYTSAFVLLDLPAGNVPVRWFNEEDLEGEIDEEQDPPRNAWDKANRSLWDKKTIDRRDYLRTPMSVQVLAPRLEEKRLYRGMKAVDDAVTNQRLRDRSLPRDDFISGRGSRL